MEGGALIRTPLVPLFAMAQDGPEASTGLTVQQHPFSWGKCGCSFELKELTRADMSRVCLLSHHLAGLLILEQCAHQRVSAQICQLECIFRARKGMPAWLERYLSAAYDTVLVCLPCCALNLHVWP